MKTLMSTKFKTRTRARIALIYDFTSKVVLKYKVPRTKISRKFLVRRTPTPV